MYVTLVHILPFFSPICLQVYKKARVRSVEASWLMVAVP